MVDITGLLRYVAEGMEVYDLGGERVGTVGFVKLSDDTIASRVAHPKEYAGEIASFDQTLTDNHVRIEDRERLIRHGFVKVNTGLLFSDRYVLPDQIEDVTDTRVWLNVAYEDLLS